MKNTMWGSDFSKKSKNPSKILNPHKPGLKNIESEVGI